MLTKWHGARRASHNQKQVEEKHDHEDESAEEFKLCSVSAKRQTHVGRTVAVTKAFFLRSVPPRDEYTLLET